MNPAELQAGLFAQLAQPFTGESLFDCLPEAVFFIKNRRCEYVVVNQTLVSRSGLRSKDELIGRRADQVFPAPFGASYRAQDEMVLRDGKPILNQLELHFYPNGLRGWCLTNKLPLRGKRGEIIGLVGVSKDLHAATERGEDYTAVAEVVQHIRANYGEPLRLRHLAARAGLSAYQFEQRIRKLFQITVGQLIQKTRLEAAMRQLRDTDDPIADIALACGYSDQSAFTRQFRQVAGLPPSLYRRRLGREHASAPPAPA